MGPLTPRACSQQTTPALQKSSSASRAAASTRTSAAGEGGERQDDDDEEDDELGGSHVRHVDHVPKMHGSTFDMLRVLPHCTWSTSDSEPVREPARERERIDKKASG
jgi:hypothetical protein